MPVNYDKYAHFSPSKANRLMEVKPSSLTHDAMREELLALEKERDRLRRVLATPREGKLLVSGSKTIPKFYRKDETGTHYLSREQIGVAAKLAQDDYYEALLQVVEARLKVLLTAVRELEKLDPFSVFERLSDKRKMLVVPEYLPDDEFLTLWSATRYSGKGFKEGDKEYYTAKGERVRSKSETHIADRCYYRDIFYLYEYPWVLPSSGVWFPDFTVVNVRTRKVYIWEHFGMEDDEAYAISSLEKLRLYQQNGFWPGENLILTHETADKPLTIRDIDEVINHYLI